MVLKDLLVGLDYKIIRGDIGVDIGKIVYDNRKAKNGDIFICIKGFKTDGHKYVDGAISNGAKVIVCEDEVQVPHGITIIKVKDTRIALAKMACNYYENPSSKMKMIGITGTNGKTTSAFMIKSILEECGYKVGLIGTIANYIGNKVLKTERTTPESLELQELFNDMVSEGVQYCVMEVSSHSLELERVHGVKFDVAVFTNLTRDHLDFHKTFENYYNAKFKLFERAENHIINIDDEYGRKAVKDIKHRGVLGSTMTVSVNNEADLEALDVTNTSKGVLFKANYNGNVNEFEVEIPGLYNVYNALGCIGASIALQLPISKVKEGLSKVTVPGRCEITAKEFKLPYDIIIDYAHTPDGLENILKTARGFTNSRLITVFGCGGDRDIAKRPIMGKIGTELSDIAIITSDNPRSEDPMVIINDILNGIEKDNHIIIENRYDAIKKAIEVALPGDVIVIAGKGHETYQILKDKTIDFDEREVVRKILEKIEVK